MHAGKFEIHAGLLGISFLHSRSSILDLVAGAFWMLQQAVTVEQHLAKQLFDKNTGSAAERSIGMKQSWRHEWMQSKM